MSILNYLNANAVLYYMRGFIILISIFFIIIIVAIIKQTEWWRKAAERGRERQALWEAQKRADDLAEKQGRAQKREAKIQERLVWMEAHKDEIWRFCQRGKYKYYSSDSMISMISSKFNVPKEAVSTWYYTRCTEEHTKRLEAKERDRRLKKWERERKQEEARKQRQQIAAEQRAQLLQEARQRLQTHELSEIKPIQFEYTVASILADIGYRHVKVTPATGDRGVDILCEDAQGRKVGVQCKYYAADKRIGSKDIQTFLGMVKFEYGAERGLYVTTADFTAEARELARKHGIELIDGKRLQTYLNTVRQNGSKQEGDTNKRGLTEPNPQLDYLKTLKVGDHGEITLQPGGNKSLVKRRTTVAAKQLGMAIKWQPSQDENKLLFEVVPVAPVADEELIDRAGKRSDMGESRRPATSTQQE